MTPEEMWANFIAHLNTVQPIRAAKRTDPPLPHKNFIGSIAEYKKVFLEANKSED